MHTKRFFLTFFLSILFILPLFAQAGFEYTPMEPIPGFENATNFCDYIQNLYKFGIWTVGVAALFMIMFGGYTYLLSAGNNASMGNAKGFIVDALIGLVLALTAYLLLYVINPDLVKINGVCAQGTATTSPTTIVPSATVSQEPSPLAPSELATGCEAYEKDFAEAAGNDPVKKCLLIAIANQESGCNPNSRSPHGACGMMQILPTTANMSCDELINDPKKSIQSASELLTRSSTAINGYTNFNVGSGNASGEQEVTYGSFTYKTGNDDLIASYNAGFGNNTSRSGKKQPFELSSDCKDTPTPAWQCDINPGGFLETQKYVMRVQDFQKKCLASQVAATP